jgi:EAL domain-containing protein (putative c-di-GMP-specific phosphodiesterase class I)
MLREDRLTTAFQPIVEVNASEQIFAYECLMRGEEDGQLVAPYRMLEVARGADLMFQLDLAARLAAIKGAAKHKITGKIFINFNPTTIYDPVYCLRSTINTLSELGLSNEQIVFEVVESDQVTDLAHLKNIINYYRKVGFEGALDDLGSGFSSLNMLHELRPDYVKLDMQLIRNVHQDPYKASITGKLLEAANELHVQTIAEGIECSEEFEWVCEHGASFVQGYYIAKPALVPPIPAPAYVLV